MKIAVLLFALLSMSAIAVAATLLVPSQYPTIQDAVNASVNGDTVLVDPGTYVENITFGGRAIVVTSAQGPRATAIDGSQVAEVVAFRSGEGPASVLEGFTITNGGTYGIYISGATPTIRGNVITLNAGHGLYCYQAPAISVAGNRFLDNSDKGIYCWYSDGAAIVDNRFESNGDDGIYCRDSHAALLAGNVIAGNTGKGIYCWYSDTVRMVRNRLTSGVDDGIYCRNSVSATIAGNIIARNGGSGIYAWYADSSRIEHNTVFANGNRGLYCRTSLMAEVTDSIFRQNSGGNVYDSGSGPTVTYCNVQGGYAGTGNFDLDPLFAAGDDFHITFTSPCRDAGIVLPATEPHDFEGDPRVVGASSDVGADEFHPHLYTVGAVLPGGTIDFKAVGVPGQPVRLGLGHGVLPAPTPTPYGDLYLPLPLKWKSGLGTVPADGILVRGAKVPSGWTPGSTRPFQALIGPPGGAKTRLSNLLLLEAE